MIKSLRFRIGPTAAFVAAIVLALGAGPAAAGTASSAMNVTATVVNNCTVSATDLVFGNYTGIVDVSSSFVVDVTCTDATGLNLADNDGLNPDVGTLRRRMILGGAADLLTYELYADAGLTNERPITTNTGTNSASFPMTLYGLLRAGQGVGTGAYSDVLLWTVTW